MEKTDLDLERIPLFTNLPPETLNRVKRLARKRSYVPGETIIVEGEPCREVYFVARGQVRVYRLSPEGREQVLARLGSGQSFNTVPPFLAQPVNHATAEAQMPVDVYVIPCADFRHLVSESPELAFTILQEFAARLDQLTDLVENLSLHTVRGRLARFLLEHVDQDDGSRRWTQEEMAAHLGTVRDMVGRTLRSFADAGLVTIDRQRIILLDKEALESEALR